MLCQIQSHSVLRNYQVSSYTDAAPTVLRDGGGVAICYIDVTPTGLRCGGGVPFCYIDVAPTGLNKVI